jgi:hypothetical protein
MPAFSDTLSEPTPQAFRNTATQSTLGGLADIAGAIAGPVTERFIQTRKNTIVEEAVQKMNREEEKLRTSLQQGKLTGGINEYTTRLNALQRELTANFPGVAEDIRTGIKANLGVLPSTSGPEALMKERDRQQRIEDALLSQGISEGTAIFDNAGNVDRAKTIANTMEKMQTDNYFSSLKARLEIAKLQQGDAPSQADLDAQYEIKYNQGLAQQDATFLPSFIKNLKDRLNDTSVPEATRLQNAATYFNEVRLLDSHRVQQILNSSGMTHTPIDAILKRRTEMMDELQQSLFGTQDISTANKTLTMFENQIKFGAAAAGRDPNLQGILVANKLMGENWMANAPVSIQTSKNILMGYQSLVNRLDPSAPDYIGNTVNDVVTGRVPVDNLTPDEKKGVGAILGAQINSSYKEPNMSEADLRTFANASIILSDMVLREGSEASKERTLKLMNNPQAYARILKLSRPNSPNAPLANQAIDSFRNLALSSLQLYQTPAHLENDTAKLTYNAVAGKFVPLSKEANLEQRIVNNPFKQQILQKARADMRDLQGAADRLNNALDVFTNMTLINPTRDKLKGNEFDIKQAVVSSFGYPMLQKRTIPEGLNEQVKESIQGSTSATPDSGGIPAGWSIKVKE